MADQFAVTWNGMGFIRYPLLFSFLAVMGFALSTWTPLHASPAAAALRSSSTPRGTELSLKTVAFDLEYTQLIRHHKLLNKPFELG